MKRRRCLELLGAAGAVLTVWPGLALAGDSAYELANRGQDLLAAGKIEEAVAVLAKARGLDPRNARVYALLGRAYFQRGHARRALAAFRLAVRLNPEDTLSRMMVETIELFPLPPKPPAGLDARPDPQLDGRAPAGRPSALEREAQEERAGLLDTGRSPRAAGPFRLLLDPGHGGADPGAVSGGLREADVALDLSLRLARALASADGLTVSLTRVADVGLPGWARAGLAGYYGADWLLSLHATRLDDPKTSGLLALALDERASGSEAAAVAAVENWAFGGEAPDGGRGGESVFLRTVGLATARETWHRGLDLAGRFVAALPAGGVVAPRPLATAPVRELAAAGTPAVLVEAGFLSNAGDAARLAAAATRDALARALAKAVLAVVRAEAGTAGN